MQFSIISGREQMKLLRQEVQSGRLSREQLIQLRRAQQSGQLNLAQLPGIQQLMKQLPFGMLRAAQQQQEGDEAEDRMDGPRPEDSGAEDDRRIFGGQRPFGRRRFRGPTAAKYQQVKIVVFITTF